MFETRAKATPWDYLSLARLDHSTKHVFILPGMLLAYGLRGVRVESLALSVVLGLAAAVCVASANYVINEWLDRVSDGFHPVKSRRSAVQTAMRGGIVYLEWATLLGLGLLCALMVGLPMLATVALFGLQGIVYNVPPLRAKDVAYLDVISESVNNPLRLIIGWLIVDPTSLPPASVVLLYWTGGAFLMTAKRLSEYREIVSSHGKATLAQYRSSFAGYTEASLTTACLVYALFTIFFMAVFMVKYRMEYILAIPLIIWLFAHYFKMAMLPGSAAQRPENLHRERDLMLLVAALVLVFLVTTVVDIPMVEMLARQRYVSLE